MVMIAGVIPVTEKTTMITINNLEDNVIVADSSGRAPRLFHFSKESILRVISRIDEFVAREHWDAEFTMIRTVYNRKPNR